MTFEVAAEAYDRFMGRYSSQLAPRLAEFSGIEAGQRVLDVGCGPGALTAELVRRVGNHDVAAVDPSELFVAAAKARYPTVDVRHASAERLPFDDGVFARRLCGITPATAHRLRCSGRLPANSTPKRKTNPASRERARVTSVSFSRPRG